MALPPRKILLVVTTGGFTHAAPVLDVAKVLADRGHTIEFATLNGQGHYIANYPFVSKLHLLGEGPTEQQYEEHYLRMRRWNPDYPLAGAMPSKYMFDSFWPVAYHGLKKIMDDPADRPDFIFGDFFVDAIKDMHIQYKTPIAMMFPQMPALMFPCSYIPGESGFQLPGTTTSENASMWLRIKNELVVVMGLPTILPFFRWTKNMRRQHGVKYSFPSHSKPDYLVFINSFFGLEPPRDLPPMAAAIGPILSDEYALLDEACRKFLVAHENVIYVALGTHVILSGNDTAKIITGVLQLLDDKVIDGVIWAVSKNGRQDMDRNHCFTDRQGTVHNLGDLLDGKNPSWLFPFFAPQRAVLAHESTKLFFTHGGGSSANEGVYHGKRMLTMGVFFDQVANMERLVHGGVAEPLHKFYFTPDELYTKARRVLEDKDGKYSRNSLRMQRIAHVASRRKYHAADLIEEVLYDNELRLQDGRELRPMHLQTADMRMPTYKARNWDLKAATILSMGAIGCSLGLVAKYAWRNRTIIQQAVSSVQSRA
ncbi:putative UDP-glucoronosyl and UDP-glucosyl transferase [Talaromyces proteolyticus]|uniref:UDP-glucoronosyl and UDP-glucosyl transferase n=1 Tax=Talaromyces proteolyticus TaxID=1131652 RepID=A0AAD4KU50_9EURO|nr:putative UDP-glucoronosyl and UDP-glucosyl transferase [Talaromyces proteolyticus]KAH8699302.1 putative UDP-glucoronosyl and UDP-glucosyl transferase [Talaromyces proteolyticus]